MTFQELQAAVNELVNNLIAKGCIRTKVQMEIESHARPAISLHWHEHEYTGLRLEWIFGDTPEITIEKARDFISNLKSLDERQRQEYREAVARAIDLGNKYGIEDAAINPLREVMERLSKNALEHHPAKNSKLDFEGDDIPF